VVRGVAARVTSATGDAGASQRVLPYQPSEHLARIARVRRPGASERFRVMDNRLHSLRKSPAQLLRGRLPRLIEQGHDRAAGLTESSRSNDFKMRVLSGWNRPKAAAQSYSWLAPTAAHARSMQVSKLRLNSEDEPSPLRLNDPSSLTNSESGTSVDSAYFASASTIQAAEALAHCSMSLSLSEGASPLLWKDSGRVHDACSR